MSVIIDKFNIVYLGGRKGKPFEVRFCPTHENCPWCVYARGHGHYYTTLTEALAFAAGRSWIEEHMIPTYQKEIMLALDRKWDE